ncbi:hypothetical protein [Pseudonocardia sp.]|uniref:hypothetical protein n=1 Tax=Pseudonocardia sp. TaxID=60912 RepID=UPI003D130A2E
MGASSVSTTDPWLSNQKVTSPEARLALSASWAKQVGSSILAESGAVEGAGPSASVSGNNILVTAHQAIVEAALGTYVCSSTATMTVPMDTPLPTSGQSRYDIIYGEIVDSSDSATYRLNTVKSAASASPSIPNAPSNTVPLFRVQVTSAGPQTPVPIMSWARAPGAPRLVETGDTRNGAYIGDRRKFRDGSEDVWSGSAWQRVVAPASWSQFTPQLLTSGDASGVPVGPNGSAIARYLVQGKSMHLRYIFRVGAGAPPAGWGDIYTQLPPGITSAPTEETQILAKLNAHNPVGTLYGIFLGKCFIPPNSNGMYLYFPFSSARSDLGTYRMSVSSAGTAGTGRPLVPGGYPIPGILVIQGTIEIS